LPHLPQRSIHSIIALWMITYVVMKKGEKRFSFSTVLNNKFFFFLGKISYGIYLYHVPVQWFGFILSPLINKYFPFSFVRQYNNYIMFAINFCILIFISWLSWKIIEKPILSLKKYFNYQDKKVKGIEDKKVAALNSV
jgi:peptidoglycan/LPS O-acetylase OafA/YrhL